MQHKVLFHQQEVADPYAIYQGQLAEGAVHFDLLNELYAVYSYRDCKAVLQHPSAIIPPVSLERLNEAALLLSGNLVRLSNPPYHANNRDVAGQLHQHIRPVATDSVLKELIKDNEIDWIKDVCQCLPALLILKGLQFTPCDSAFIISCIPRLVQLMLPVKTETQVAAINAVAADIYELLADYLRWKNMVDREDIPAAISNLTGLLIQSHDAGSGILANALLHFLHGGEALADKRYLQLCVQETLRFDPPVQHTRRLAKAELQTGRHMIPAGALVIVMLAAANRDPEQFARPEEYDIHRPNNHTHLTFGTGMHQCMAQRFSITMTTNALYYLFSRYQHIQLQQNVRYLPLYNARVPESLFIRLK